MSISIDAIRSRLTSATVKPTAPSAGTVSTQATLPRDRFVASSQWTDPASTLARAAIAGNVAYQGGAQTLGSWQSLLNAFKSFDLSGLFGSVQALGKAALGWSTKAAGMQAAVSLVVNGYRAMNHQESWGRAGTNVVMDGAAGAVSGAAGAVVGGLGSMVLGMLGLAGGPLTLAAAVVGMGGYYLADRAFRSSTLYRRLESGVAGVFGEATRPLNV